MKLTLKFSEYRVAAVIFLVVPALFTLGQFTAQIPGGGIVPVPGWPAMKTAASASVLIVFLHIALSALYRVLGVPGYARAALRDLWPVLVMAFPFFRVYILHGLFHLDPQWGVLFSTIFCLFAVGILVAINVLARLLSGPSGLASRLKGVVDARRFSDSSIALGLFFFSLIFYAGMIAFEDRYNQIVGDEPHYLVIMESLKNYGTADLTGILEDESPRLGDGVRIMGQPHISSMSLPGTNYSIHHIGLPILLIPWHLALGFKGVMLFFAVMGSFTIANLYLVNRLLSSSRTLSALFALVVGLAAPFSSYFRMIYPDPVAACLLIYAARILLFQQSSTRFSLMLASAALAYLPWLHVKYLFLVAPFTLCYFIVTGMSWRRDRVKGTPWFGREQLARLLPFVFLMISGVSMMLFFHHTFGNWRPDAQYRPGEGVASKFLVRGLLGQFFDRDHGVIPVAPFYLMLIPGLLLALKKQPRLALLMFAIAGTYIVGTAGHSMWWGGPCAPGRFMMPALALLAPTLVIAFERNQSVPIRAAWLFFAAIAAFSSLCGLVFPDVLTRHVNVVYGFLRGLEAHPAFPCFYWDKNDPEQISSYYTMLVWAAGVFSLFTLYGINDKTKGQVFRGSWIGLGVIFCIGGYFLAVGGAGKANDWFMERDPNRYFEQNIRLARVTYPIQLFAGPIQRAGLDSFSVQDSIHPPVTLAAELPRWHGAGLTEIEDAPRVFMSGPYTVLFPVYNRIVFTYEAQSASPEAALGYVEVTASGEHEVLARKALNANATRVVLEPRVERRVDRVEFRAAIQHPGTLRIKHITYEAQVGREASKPE